MLKKITLLKYLKYIIPPKLIRMYYQIKLHLHYFIVYKKDHGWFKAFKKTYYFLEKRNFFGKLLITQFSTKKELSSERVFYDFVFVIGCWEGTAKRYRVYDRVRYLEGIGAKSLIIKEEDCWKITANIFSTKVIVFFRVADRVGGYFEELFSFTKNNNILTVWDVDDLIFNDKYFKFMRGAAALKEPHKTRHRLDLINYKNMLSKVNLALFPTKTLLKEALNFNNNCEIVLNGFDNISLTQSQSILKNKYNIARSFNKSSGQIYIGYFSGTNTHDVDFLACEEALIKILEKYEFVSFVLGGFLKLSNKFIKFKERIIRLPFVNYHNQLIYLSLIDVNIAPLEVGNIFCEAKSNLKFYEAALVKVPTIASATEPFVSSIIDGFYGYTATNAADWFIYLEKMIINKKHRVSLGENAYEFVTKNYNQKVTGSQFLSVINKNLKVPINYTIKKSPKKISKTLRIAFIVPGLNYSCGGTRNIFRIASRLSQLNNKITIYIKNEDHQRIAQMKEDIAKNFYNFEYDLFHLSSIPTNQDILFATHWSTVYDALKFKNNISEIFYFVQDLEFYFHSMSSDYIKAENTYKLPIKFLCCGRLPFMYLKNNFNVQDQDIDYFNFPLDKKTYFLNRKIKKKKQIIFFAKPEMPRRCYELGFEVLTILKDRLIEHNLPYEIILFGSNQVSIDHKKIFKNLGILPTIKNLAKLYNESSLGIAFSTTNPSLVPFEMMACGLPVIDLNLNNSKDIYYFKNKPTAFLVSSIPEIMANQILEYLENEKKRESHIKNSFKFINTFSTDNDIGQIIHKKLLKLFYYKD